MPFARLFRSCRPPQQDATCFCALAEIISLFDPSPPVAIDTHLIPQADVPLLPIIPWIGEQLYTGWFNYHAHDAMTALTALGPSEQIPVHLADWTVGQLRVLTVRNSLQKFSRRALTRLAVFSPWSREAVDAACPAVRRAYPIPERPWDAL